MALEKRQLPEADRKVLFYMALPGLKFQLHFFCIVPNVMIDFLTTKKKKKSAMIDLAIVFPAMSCADPTPTFWFY